MIKPKITRKLTLVHTDAIAPTGDRCRCLKRELYVWYKRQTNMCCACRTENLCVVMCTCNGCFALVCCTDRSILNCVRVGIILNIIIIKACKLMVSSQCPALRTQWHVTALAKPMLVPILNKAVSRYVEVEVLLVDGSEMFLNKRVLCSHLVLDLETFVRTNVCKMLKVILQLGKKKTYGLRPVFIQVH